MTLHVFVAMPFGMKEGINFNKVYEDFIKPTLEEEGFDVFRADEEIKAGNIRTDMFQELLLADLVVADLSIDNPNVWYELGVRHALRARGVIQINCQRDYMPFDVYTDHALRYHVKDGIPDPDFLDEDKKALSTMANATISSWHGRKISPVYHHLNFLKEPDWKSLVIRGDNEFGEKQDIWERSIEVARQRQRPGDILVLADEAPIQALRLEAYYTAGKALLKLGKFLFALEQTEKALDIDPENLECQHQKGILLGRLEKYYVAKEWLEAVLEDHLNDPETLSLLGRVEKDAWVNAWRKNGSSREEMVKEAVYEDNLLREAIKPYLNGFLLNPGHYYSGINAITLLHLLCHLTGEDDQAEMRQAMEGGIRWAIQSALENEKPDSKDYWARVTLGDLEVLLSDIPVVTRAYKYAVAAAEKDWFALNSSRQQLLLLKDLGFRIPQVEAAIEIFDRALSKLKAPEVCWEPRTVFLFSGHMIDAPDRPEPRFPADKEPVAAQAIAAKLDELGAGPEDVALCGGACGGDLLFAEACLERGLRLEIRIPFDEPKFLQESVIFAGESWRDRFYQVKSHENTTFFIMPEEIGQAPERINSYDRNNVWQLYTALAWQPDKLRFITLWNRKKGDGPGGTKHMHDEVIKHSGHVYILDTNELFLYET